MQIESRDQDGDGKKIRRLIAGSAARNPGSALRRVACRLSLISRHTIRDYARWWRMAGMAK